MWPAMRKEPSVEAGIAITSMKQSIKMSNLLSTNVEYILVQTQSGIWYNAHNITSHIV